jgi:hypothetical protein
LLKKLQKDFWEAYKEVPLRSDEFWETQRQKAQKIIKFLWTQNK